MCILSRNSICVVVYEPVHGSLHDLFEPDILHLCSLFDQGSEVSGYASHDAHRQFLAPIGCHIAAEEAPEVFEHQHPQRLALQVFGDERRE